MVDADQAQVAPQTSAVATVYLSLGANLGDRRESLRLAITSLANHSDISLDTNRDVARLFQTSPVDCEDTQPPYLNTAVRISTSLAPLALLTQTQSIELELGRVRRASVAGAAHELQLSNPKNQARTIDIDILLYGDLVCHDERLELPHPRIAKRSFVLEPLADLAPDQPLPPSGVTVAETAQTCRRRYQAQAIEIIAERGWATDFGRGALSPQGEGLTGLGHATARAEGSATLS